MKILKHGYKETGIITFECCSCGCVFEGSKSEYEHYHSSMCVNRNGDTFVITCPECNVKLRKNGCLAHTEIIPNN